MENQNKQAARRFAVALAASLSKSLTEAAGTTLQLSVADTSDITTPYGQQIHLRLTADGALHGECFLELFEPQIAALFAKASGKPPASFDDAQAEALGKAVSAAMAGVAASLSTEYGEITFKVDRVTNPTFDRSQVVQIAGSGTEQTDMRALLFLGPKIVETLSSLASGRVVVPEKPRIDAPNLKLVMDVELSVALRFGQRQLPLREVLELASGSVVELDCQVDEPIDLLLDGKVIARGEAVIVDGNYGLRVTEIPQPLESHFS